MVPRHLLCVGQHITESTFQHTLADNDVQVERPVTVSEFELDDDPYPIKATLHNVSSEEKTVIRAKYLLGCDGAHSGIRRQLGIQNDGQTTCMNSGVLDALVKSNFPDKKSVRYEQRRSFQGLKHRLASFRVRSAVRVCFLVKIT